MNYRTVKHVETEKTSIETSRAERMRSNMVDSLVISGIYDKKETYQLVLRGEWFSRAHTGPLGTRHYFLEGVTKEFADIICEKNVGYRLGFKDGLLIIDRKRLEVPKVENNDLELMLRAELEKPSRGINPIRNLIFPVRGRK